MGATLLNTRGEILGDVFLGLLVLPFLLEGGLGDLGELLWAE